MDEFEYINRTYGLKLSKGAKAIFQGKPGIVKGTRGPYVKIALDESPKKVDSYHPTWEMEYPT